MGRQFKIINVNAPESATGVEMGLVLDERTSRKLNVERERLSSEFGFEVTDANVIAYLLRNVTDSQAIWRKDAEDLMRADRKIDAIKLVRASTQMGLKEAKDYVEKYWEHLRPSKQPPAPSPMWEHNDDDDDYRP